MYIHISPDLSRGFAVTKTNITKNGQKSHGTSFLRGQPISRDAIPTPITATVSIPRDTLPPHYLGSSIPMMSSQLVGALLDCGVDNFQAFPTEIQSSHDSSTWADYFAVNAIGIITAANLEESSYDTLFHGDSEGIGTPLVGFHDIVLVRERLPEHFLMFRLATSPDVLLLHNTVAKALIERQPAEGWGFSMEMAEIR